MKRALAGGMAMTAAISLGGAANHMPENHVDQSLTFDITGGERSYDDLTPGQAQEALATGISCDVNEITALYKYPATSDTGLMAHPHTELDFDVSLHFTPQAAAAYDQYRQDNRVLWNEGAAVEVIEKETPKDPKSTLKDLGSTGVTTSGAIEYPDMLVMVPTENIKPKNTLVPYRSVYLKTSKETWISKIPCGQVIDIADNGAFQLHDWQLPTHISKIPSGEQLAWGNQAYNGTFLPHDRQ